MTASSLAEFLLSAIAEDEADSYLIHDYIECDKARHAMDDPRFGWECTCGYPARVLAECAANRQIVELYRQSVTDLEVAKGNNLGGMVSDPLEIAEFAGIQMGLEWAVQALAAPFSDRDDFRAEWAS